MRWRDYQRRRAASATQPAWSIHARGSTEHCIHVVPCPPPHRNCRTALHPLDPPTQRLVSGPLAASCWGGRGRRAGVRGEPLVAAGACDEFGTLPSPFPKWWHAGTHRSKYAGLAQVCRHAIRHQTRLYSSSAVVTARAIRTLILMTLGVAHAQAMQPPPLVVGAPLTTRDVSEITALAGSEPPVWMIKVGKQCPRSPCIAVAYLRPEVETPTLRRGNLIFLDGDTLGDDPKMIRWHVVLRQSWAQVALPGKPFGKELRKPSDITGRFFVQGQIPDQLLVDVVRFIRNLSPSERISHALKDLPISAVVVDSNGAITMQGQIDEGGMSTTQEVKLSQEAGGWKIKSVSVERAIVN